MNTSAGYYRAPRPARVPLDEVLIKLHPEGFHQAFDADGINVGAGGLSMRASVLPEVGSTLRCQLENPTGGEAIEMIGRVVWAHESGPKLGEFGIRFTQLSDDDQMRIEALIQRWGRTTAKPPTVRLLLDGVGSAIVAEVQSESGTQLSVEQPLPFLAIGSAVLNESIGRRGHLEAVELKMDERTPKLVLSIGYEVEDDPEAAPNEGGDRDTLPDETPPAAAHANRRSSHERLHDAPRIVCVDPVAEATASETAVVRLRASASSAVGHLVGALGAARTGLTEGLLPRIETSARELFALTGRFIGALRSRIDEKPRRKQVPRSEAARAHLKNARRDRRHYWLGAALLCGAAATGAGIYLLATSGSPEVASDDETVSPAPNEPEASGQPDATAEAAGERAAAVVAAPEAHPPQAAPRPPETVRGTWFGAQRVEGGEKYVLRMSNSVTEIHGIVEEDGFSVTIPGSLSLSRAGPIASAHPDIESASILNRGDYSELTLRFVSGRRPAYRVEARGPAIEITIGRAH